MISKIKNSVMMTGFNIRKQHSSLQQVVVMPEVVLHLPLLVTTQEFLVRIRST
jgi:hypothetical protein